MSTYINFQVFNGPSGRNDIVKHNLKEIARARFIRFQPVKYKSRKALRVEVYGILMSRGIIMHPFYRYYNDNWPFLVIFNIVKHSLLYNELNTRSGVQTRLTS